MNRQELFSQCRMTRGRSETVGFIPAKAAVVGNVVRLDIKGAPRDGWRIDAAGAGVAKDAMRMFERQYTSQRAGSDV